MKRAVLLIFIMLATLSLTFTQVVASPAANKGGVKPTPHGQGSGQDQQNDDQKAKPAKPEKVNIKGMIVDLSESSITIEAKQDGALLTFAVTKETQVKIPWVVGEKITDLEVGEDVTIKGIKAEDGTLTAQRISLIPGKYKKLNRVGEVTDYQPGVSITISDKDGSFSTFVITAETIILPKDRAGELAMGRRVTIIMPRSMTGSDPTAKKIVVHPIVEDEETEAGTTDG